jgi:hypothetical protein
MILPLEDVFELRSQGVVLFINTSRFQIFSEQNSDESFIPIHCEQTHIYHPYNTLFRLYTTR